MASTILIVDDDPVQRRLLEAQVLKMGHRPLLADGGGRALDILAAPEGGGVAAVMLDLVMPGTGGLEVLAEMGRRGLAVPVVVQTGRGGVETVVEAMRAGAFDFVVKPASPEKVQAAIRQALQVGGARKRLADVPSAGADDALDHPRSPAMAGVLKDARRAAASAIPVLIEGETGVGKEWLARAIRAAGPRRAAPFVAVNCGALPAALVESILFGHEKGAFTDATDRRAGKFVEADGGTLFLDEVGELPPEAQVKLLRVLQSGDVDAVGARASVRTDVRVVSATNRDLAADVAAGRFREDLYYRLNVLSLRVPPLRERRAEIAGLCRHLLARYCALEGIRPPRRLSAEAAALLSRHDWPGNIRQLENAVHRAIVVSDETVLGPSSFPQIAAFATGEPLPEEPSPAPAPALAIPIEAPDAARPGGLSAFDAAGHLRSLEAVERDLVRLALERYGGRMSEVARRLGIGRSTLYRKLRAYGIEPVPVDPDTPDEADR